MSASESVGCAWIVLAIDSVVASSSSAAQPSTISFVWRARSDDVHAEDLVVFLVGDVLHEADGLAEDLRLRVRGEGELAGLDVVAALLRLLLRQPHRRHLGVRVRAVRHVVVIERTHFEALHVLDREDALGRGDVGERGGRDDVADRVDPRLARAHVLIDLHEAALDLDLRLLQAAVLRHGAAAGRGEDELRLDRLLLAFRFDDGLHAVLADLARHHLRVGEDVDALLLEDARELLRHFFVLDREEERHDLDDRHLRAEAREDRGELAADRARADDEHRLRHVLQFEDVVGVDDALAVGLDVRQVLRHGAHGQDDVLGLVLLPLDVDGVAVDDRGETLQALDFVLAEEELDAFDVGVDDALLARLHGAEVELRVADGDAELFRLLDLVPDVGVLEEGLGRNAAAEETGAADVRVLLDDGHFHAELPGADARDVAARSAADDDEVVCLVCHAAGII